MPVTMGWPIVLRCTVSMECLSYVDLWCKGEFCRLGAVAVDLALYCP